MFGSPTTLKTDRGKNFANVEFQQFCMECNVEHQMSSAEHHQGNGLSEAGVKLMKNLRKKNMQDQGKALMEQEHKATPGNSGYSPSRLFLCRQIKTTLPSLQNPSPFIPSAKAHKRFLEERKTKAKIYYDQKHKVKILPELERKTRVWIPDLKRYRQVKQMLRPRSYEIITDQNTTITRNRKDIVEAPAPKLQEPAKQTNEKAYLVNINNQASSSTAAKRPTRVRQLTARAQDSNLKIYKS